MVPAMWLDRPSAPTAITQIIRMLARLTDTTAQAGSRMGSSLAQAPGSTVDGDTDITAPAGDTDITAAALPDVDMKVVDLRDAALLDVALSDMVRLGTASHLAARLEVPAEGPTVEAVAAVVAKN